VLIEAARSLLFLVDVQARLAPAVPEADACVRQCRILVQAARRLEVPVLAPSRLWPSFSGLTR